MKKIILTNSFKRPRASEFGGRRSLCDENVRFTNVFATIEEIIYTIEDKLNSTPLVIPASQNDYDIENIVKFVDGIILSGGSSNINPKFYGEKITVEGQKFDENHDNLDFNIIRYAIKYDKPILGICRGMQTMNVACGGTLIQRLPKTNIDHCISYKNEGMTEEEKYMHDAILDKNGLLYNLVKTENIKVNSMHEQAVDKIGNGLQVEAVSNDNVVEAFSMADKKFFLGLQWHPEALLDSNLSEKIFRLFKENL